MASDISNSLVSRHFSNQYVWLRYKQNKDVRWDIYNTEVFRKEAVELEKTFFCLMNNDTLKWRKRKKLWKKGKKWRYFHRIYGLEDERSLKYFKRLIRYIEKNEGFAEENHDYNEEDCDYSFDEASGRDDEHHEDNNEKDKGDDNELVTELRTYKVLLDDMQKWLKDAKTIISKEIKPSSEKVLRGQIREIENLEQDLSAHSVQLEHLLTGVQKLVGDRDVQSLANDMISIFGSMPYVIEETHQCLGLRLQQLLETLKEIVIGDPEDADIQKDLADTSNSEPSKGPASELLPDLEDVPSLKKETFDDGEVVDESQINVEDDHSSDKNWGGASEIPLKKKTVLNEKRDGVNANENPANGGEVDKVQVETTKSKNINKDKKDESLKKTYENLDYGPTLEGGGILALTPPLGCVDSVKNTSMILNLEEDKLPRNNLVKEKLKMSDKMTAVNGPSNEHFLMFLKNFIEDNKKVKFISNKRVGEENPMLKTKSTDQRNVNRNLYNRYTGAVELVPRVHPHEGVWVHQHRVGVQTWPWDPGK